MVIGTVSGSALTTDQRITPSVAVAADQAAGGPPEGRRGAADQARPIETNTGSSSLIATVVAGSNTLKAGTPSAHPTPVPFSTMREIPEL
ncbi:unannotated protein [freshwater metagenome]|uniref:Unannotated protein n=1 Tax=freshwater metagenome TaxID=449393 RepID=A0A6J7FVQ7_9ZZZZ